jgi:hypothetical protein
MILTLNKGNQINCDNSKHTDATHVTALVLIRVGESILLLNQVTGMLYLVNIVGMMK